MAGQDAGLIGRDAELARLHGLVDPPPADSRVLLVLGEAGMGKTALLAEVARQAASSGLRVLSTAGRESERDLAFAGLHQLLRPVLDRVAALPDRQAKALLGALALAADPVPPDALLTGIAVLTLLSGLAEEGPLLVLADDAQWLDRASLDALSFTARRLEAEPLALLAGARGHAPPPGFERDFAELTLPPLGTRDARRLLDRQPYPPRGRAREQVLAQAAGNPLALIELSRAIAADPGAGRRWAAEPLPLTDRLAAITAAGFGALPGPARAALLLAAVADSAGQPGAGQPGAGRTGPDLTASVPGLTAEVLAPAEAAGLIRVGPAGPQFTHPLVRAAVYHAVPFTERAEAHLRIADGLRDQPDRRAWHLAAAALEPDERVAALLEQTAAQAQRRGGTAAAARALERAAELSPAEQDQGRRLLAAAALAVPSGQADWVRELATRALSVTTEPVTRIMAQLHIGWSLVWSDRHAEALAALIPVAIQACDRLPAVAWGALGLAGTVAYQTGTPASRAAVLGTLDRMTEPPAMTPGQASLYRLWVQVSSDPFGARGVRVPGLHVLAGGPVSDLGTLGAAAWLLDETETAVRLLREALGQLRAPGMRGRSGAVLTALEWACVDSGRFDGALAAAREARDTAAAYTMETVAASADLAAATVLAIRGEPPQPLLASALANVDEAEYRAYAARARHAAGLAALACGDYQGAYAQLSQLFGADGTPLHHHVSYLGLADLAAAAVRADRAPATRPLVERALARLDPAPGPRVDLLAARARGLLAEPGEAGAQLGHDGPAHWPFERAQLRLDYGEWLRRQRRINDAKPVLAEALEVFGRLGATPWQRRAEAELRACGVTTRAEPGTLAGLTAQQREIVVLASRGLTNGEIADRLFLSPRTVASHLYRSYPKLGIAGRHQLRDLVEADG